MNRSFEVKAPKVRAEYHRAQAMEHDAAGFPAMAQWHREMALWLDPPPRVKPPKRERISNDPTPQVPLPASSPRRMERVQRANPPAGTRVAGFGPQGRVLARRKVA